MKFKEFKERCHFESVVLKLDDEYEYYSGIVETGLGIGLINMTSFYYNLDLPDEWDDWKYIMENVKGFQQLYENCDCFLLEKCGITDDIGERFKEEIKRMMDYCLNRALEEDLECWVFDKYVKDKEEDDDEEDVIDPVIRVIKSTCIDADYLRRLAEQS